ncbi:zinc finger HIT domain-containing 3 isoform X2, putative [Babesia ovata]|uniref:Zinc finger HIT domain-containing 3 isoform X2, putative n=1 Tax=Babesia ovata TaxID=189622 RepID=A0A2H6KE80_9APIC|nr:zinc finger HIT domain-containing 3 isoform X2, putative [Babesia ovata]GBE61296.1 zinc finger HIT domain-containing 3 isoform X2, putative [Babesia ovata]
MVSFYELWSRGIDLWVTAVLKDLRRHRKKALLRLLATIARRRGYEAISEAIIHCRGDRLDPLMILLLRLCELSRFKDAAKSDSTNSPNLFKQQSQNGGDQRAKGESQAAMSATSTLSRCILSALTPLLLHVFVTRRKVPLKLQGLCHCYSAIMSDVMKFLENTGKTVSSRGLRCTKSATRSRTSRSFRRAGPVVGISASNKLDRSLLRSRAVLAWLRQADPSESASATEIVMRVKASSAGNGHLVDNVSGLQAVLVAVANSCNLESSAAIPSSLHQLHDQFPSSQTDIKARIENAIVYLQRIRSLDLDYKYTRSQMLRDAAKSYAALRQGREGRSDKPVREQTVWHTIKDHISRYPTIWRHHDPIATPSYCYDTAKTGPQCPPLDDAQVSTVVGRCLVFCGDHLSGFSKICSAVNHAGSGIRGPLHSRLLHLAAGAMVGSCPPEEDTGDTSILKLRTVDMAYYAFLRVVEAVCGTRLIAIEPRWLRPPSQLAVQWVVDDVMYSVAEHGISESEAQKDDVVDDTNVNDDAKVDMDKSNRATHETPVATTVTTPKRSSVKGFSSLLANRNAIVASLSESVGRRIYLSEDAALCILRAHATIFKVHFDHLREAFKDMHETFTATATSSDGEKESQGNRESLVAHVNELFAARRSDEDGSKRSLSRLMESYTLFAYARLVFSQLSLRTSNEMFPRAFWLSNRHMDLLGRRVRGDCPALYGGKRVRRTRISVNNHLREDNANRDWASDSAPNVLRTDGKETELSEPQITALKEDQKLRSMLSNKVLRKVLRKIASSPDPASAIAPYMRDEFFSGFVTQVLETLDAVNEPAADDPSALNKS